MVFVNPLYLLILLLLLVIIVWYILKQNQFQASVYLSSLEGFKKVPKTYKIYLRHMPFVLRIITLIFLIVSLARPQMTNSLNETSIEGINIILTLDVSSSMLAEDLKPNRLEAAKNVATFFIKKHYTDNIGLVIFSGEGFTQCPLTTNHAVLLNLLNNASCGMIEDGTAIGNGLVTAISRLKNSQAKSKVIILLTDGSNNKGEIAPITAGELAKLYNIRIYTIGVGTKGVAPYPFHTFFGIRYQNIPVEIDEITLMKIAKITGGSYFRATNTNGLKKIYQKIDKLEKTKMNIQEYTKRQEKYMIFALAGLFFFLIELILRYCILKKIP